jgi:hypothetical protein
MAASQHIGSASSLAIVESQHDEALTRDLDIARVRRRQGIVAGNVANKNAWALDGHLVMCPEVVAIGGEGLVVRLSGSARPRPRIAPEC